MRLLTPESAAIASEWRWPPRGLARPPLRDPKYLAYVRAFDCCRCGAPGPSDPHHEGSRGMAQKCDDFRTIPLCRRCHGLRDVPREHGGWGGTPEEVAWVQRIQLDLLIGWLGR